MSAQGYSVAYNFASHNQKRKIRGVFLLQLGKCGGGWVKSRRGYLTDFATPSRKRVRGRWRWKERRRDKWVEWVTMFHKTMARNCEEMRKGKGRWCWLEVGL